MGSNTLHVNAVFERALPLPNLFRALDDIVAPLGFSHIRRGKSAEAKLLNPAEIIDWPEYDRIFPFGQVIIFTYEGKELFDVPMGEGPFSIMLRTWVPVDTKANQTSGFSVETNVFDYYSNMPWYPRVLAQVTSLASALHQAFSCKRTTVFRGEELDILEPDSEIIAHFER